MFGRYFQLNVVVFIFITLINGYVEAHKPLRHVFVSVAPQKILVQRLVDQGVHVDVVVQPGQDPHTYEPSPKQIARLAQADLYVRIGIPFETTWMTKIRSVNPQMDVVNLTTELHLPHIHEHGHEHEHHMDQTPDANVESEQDPHIWTSPSLMKRMVITLRDYLIQHFPYNAVSYRTNATALIQDIITLENDIKAIFSTIDDSKPCRFMVFHPAWGHFATAYGLEQISIQHNGKFPGAKTLGALISKAQSWGLKVIFVQPQFDRKIARVVAQSLKGRIEILDPLALDYFGNLRHVAQSIARTCAP
ncbi:hypothetical protein TI03_02545 [Achromatium sp. WMS1]|nr:hypothetical protein TI03_02545 [Achromatium sp. WMS1]